MIENCLVQRGSCSQDKAIGSDPLRLLSCSVKNKFSDTQIIMLIK